MPNFYNIAIRIANVTARLAVLGLRLRDELGSSTSPKLITRLNICNADIHACYALWKSRGAEFITEPMEKYGETRCYIRDPDGYIIEVGQNKPGFTYGSGHDT